MIVEIKGVQFVNKGAELMLCAVMQQVARLYTDAELALLPGPNSPYKKRAKLSALQIMPLQFWQRDFNWIVRFIPTFARNKLKDWFGIIFQQDVDLVLDASGFAYGDRWGGVGVKFLAANTSLVRSHGGKYILLPQAFGPFSSQTERLRMKNAVSCCELIYARDSASIQHLIDCGCAVEKLRLAPDFTNLVQIDNLTLHYPVGFYAVLIPNYQMIKGKTVSDVRQYMDLMINYIRLCLARSWTVVILNHEGSIDAEICKDLHQQFIDEPSVQMHQPENALEVKAWIGHAGLVFSSRFHGCVSALSQGVPCIGTSWSHKYEYLFSDYQMDEWLLPLNCSALTLESLVSAASSPELKIRLNHRSAQLQTQATNMWLEIADKTTLRA